MDMYKSEEAYEDLSLQEIYERGNDVGDLARRYFGDYKLVDFDKGLSSMIEETQEFINSGATNIAEASFSYNGNFCSVDILHKSPYGWDIVEVKSSTYVHSVYLDDMAYQWYVLRKCGLNITGVYNMHLNSNYVRRGELDLNQLFTVEDCTEEVFLRMPYIEQNIQQIEQFFARTEDFEPEYDIGMHCESPYECAYKGYCQRNLPKPNIFDVRGRLAKKKKYQFYYDGIISFEDIAKKAKLSKKQMLQVETDVLNKQPTVDKKHIKKCLDELTYPLYYLDFETYMQAVPKYDGISPYMQIPFQYSLHIQYEKGGVYEHREHLGKEGTDTRRALAEQLCKDIPKDVCSLAYNMKFEKMIIRQLANEYPDLAEHLMDIHDNMKDLMVPFEKGDYYCKEMQGSYSIKYVLPALCHNDPELDYHNLDQIHNGSEASTTFANLHTKSPEEIESTRKNMLAYCGLDTLAMVKILEKLYEICEKK
jgi:hypothetical protein